MHFNDVSSVIYLVCHFIHHSLGLEAYGLKYSLIIGECKHGRRDKVINCGSGQNMLIACYISVG